MRVTAWGDKANALYGYCTQSRGCHATGLGCAFCLEKGHTMVLLRKAALLFSVMRLMALPACLVWGIWELCALQRARWLGRKFRY